MSGGMPPQEKFFISDLLRSFLVPLWGKMARAGRSTAKSVIVYQAFIKTLAEFKGVAPLRSAEAAKQPLGAGKKKSYCTRSVVALWS